MCPFSHSARAACFIALFFLPALHGSCPPEGKSALTGKARDDDEARNRAKRFVARNTTPVLLTIADLQLQLETDPDASHATRLLVPRHLRHLRAGSLIVSKGDRVSLTGYLQRVEEGATSESVNCDGRDGRDIHMNVSSMKPVTAYDEWTGIVIEVAPQVPLPGYRPNDHVAMLHGLQAVMRAHLKILAIGSLTYDNEHQVNADKHHPNGSNPKRISLWEIHPVLAFYVCPSGMTCDAGAPHVNWRTLKDWSGSGAQREAREVVRPSCKARAGPVANSPSSCSAPRTR